jgi:hypothetical protein
MEASGKMGEIKMAEMKMAETESLDVLALTANDPVLCDLEMPLRGVYYPRGFAVEITTNSQEVLECAQESWGQSPKTFSAPPLQLRVGVLGDGAGIRPPIPTSRAWRNLMIMTADANNFSAIDLRQGIGFCWFTQAAVEDRPYLRYNFLDAAVFCMLQHLYLAPLHAGCVRFRDRGVLLCGDSGAGKSSLSYACARRGWTFVSDDATSLVRGSTDLTVIGSPHQMRFRAVSIDLFPELSEQSLTERATGDLAFEVPTASMPEISTAFTSSVDYVVFLNRREPVPFGLVPFPKESASAWFEQIVTHGEDESRREQRQTLRKLMDRPILELHYSDLDEAIDCLEAMVREGA